MLTDSHRKLPNRRIYHTGYTEAFPNYNPYLESSREHTYLYIIVEHVYDPEYGKIVYYWRMKIYLDYDERKFIDYDNKKIRYILCFRNGFKAYDILNGFKKLPKTAREESLGYDCVFKSLLFQEIYGYDMYACNQDITAEQRRELYREFTEKMDTNNIAIDDFDKPVRGFEHIPRHLKPATPPIIRVQPV